MLATTPASILIELQARGVRFVVADDRLRWMPRDAVQAEEVELLRRFKPDLIRLLTLSNLVAAANARLPPGVILTPADWQRLDAVERCLLPAVAGGDATEAQAQSDDYLAVLASIIQQHAATDQSTVSTTTCPPDERWDVWLCRVQQELTGRTWYATTPLMLADDDHLTDKR